jgi:hypothetical protein
MWCFFCGRRFKPSFWLRLVLAKEALLGDRTLLIACGDGCGDGQAEVSRKPGMVIVYVERGA